MKILRPGLVLLQYVGVIEILFRLKVENRKHIMIEPNDYVLVDDVSAVYMEKGTQFKRVDTDVDLSTFMQGKDPLEFVDDAVLMAELMERDIVEKPSLSDFSDEDLENEIISRGLTSVKAVVDDVSGDGLDDETVTPPESHVVDNPDVGASVSASDAEAEKEAAEKEAAEKAEKEAAEKEVTVLTKANVMDADIKDIKAACKTHKIKIGNNKRQDLIGLLMPFLEA